ncbi:MAG: signal recognition particle protein, partial [Spirochaetes bacterium]
IGALLGDEAAELEPKGPDTVSVILMGGLQGSGKTTTAAKLALRLKGEGRRVLLAAADLTRPAAADQLSVLAGQVGVAIYREDGSKPEKVAKNAYKKAKKEQFNVLIVDTAGRMQADEELMKEIRRVKDGVNPDEVLLVADAMTGQNAVEIAKSFDETLNITGIVLSKFDSDARGGAALSFKSVIGKPVKFIGVGEKIENLEPFYPERIASRILGMGDVVSLVEKVQETIETDEAEKLQEKMAKSTFTLEDYLDQFARMRKMGSMSSLLEMIPGMAGQIDESKLDEKQWKKEEAIILSMTLEERRNHRIIGPPRRKRIAKGSGTTVSAVNRLLKNFDKSRTMMRKMAKNKKMQQQLMGGMADPKI